MLDRLTCKILSNSSDLECELWHSK